MPPNSRIPSENVWLRLPSRQPSRVFCVQSILELKRRVFHVKCFGVFFRGGLGVSTESRVTFPFLTNTFPLCKNMLLICMHSCSALPASCCCVCVCVQTISVITPFHEIIDETPAPPPWSRGSLEVSLTVSAPQINALTLMSQPPHRNRTFSSSTTTPFSSPSSSAN